MSDEKTKTYLDSLYKTRSKLLISIGSAAETQEVQSYSFSDSDGSQSATRRDMKALMESLEAINKEIQRIEDKLNGIGGAIGVFNTRRHA